MCVCGWVCVNVACVLSCLIYEDGSVFSVSVVTKDLSFIVYQCLTEFTLDSFLILPGRLCFNCD